MHVAKVAVTLAAVLIVIAVVVEFLIKGIIT